MHKPIQYLLTVFTLLFTQNIFAQGPFYEWHKTAGGEGSDHGRCITVGSSGNIYVSGFFEQSISFSGIDEEINLESNGLNEIFINKTNPNGDVVWALSLGGESFERGRSIVVDEDENIYLLGTFGGTIDFDPSENEFNLTTVGQNDIYLLKLDSDGNFIWVKTIGGNSNDIGADLYLGADDHFYITGWFENTVDFDPGEGVSNLTAAAWSDCFIQKLDLDGNFVWAERVGGALFDEAHAIAVDIDGNVLVTGFFENTVDFDPGISEVELSSNGNEDVFVLKLDSSGDYVWAKSFGSTGVEDVHDIVVDSNGAVYTTGFFTNEVDFDPSDSDELVVTNGSLDIFVHKLDADGNFEWVKTYGGDEGDEGEVLSIDSEDNIYISGVFRETVDFDLSSDEGLLTATPGFGGDAFFLKLTSSGDYLWSKAFEGAGGIYFNDLYIDVDNNMFITGFFTGANDFDPNQGVVLSSSNGIQADIFTLKLSPTCNQILNSTETETVCMGDSFTFPDGTTEDNITSQVVYVSELQSIELCDSLVETTVNVVAIDTEITSFGSVLTASESGSYQWLDCSNGNSEIAGATSQTYTPSVNGEYAVRITKNACEAVSDCIAVNNVGLLENSLGTSVSVYPNPSIGTIQLDLGEVLTGNTTVRINNLLGQTVYESSFHNRQHYEINFEGSEGMYVLELENENGTRALLPIVKE